MTPTCQSVFDTFVIVESQIKNKNFHLTWNPSNFWFPLWMLLPVLSIVRVLKRLPSRGVTLFHASEKTLFISVQSRYETSRCVLSC